MATKTVTVYRVCDGSHRQEVRAEHTDRFTLNGHRYEVDLCEECSAKLYADVQRWAVRGTKLGGPSNQFEVARKPTTSVVTAPRPAAPPVEAERRRQQAMSREPMPATAQRWTLTSHAVERMAERGLDKYEVLMACERPETITPSTSTDDVGREVRVRGDVRVVVYPQLLSVLTCMRTNVDDQKVSA